MSKEKQIKERNELVELLEDTGRDWDAYIDECQENEELPEISYYFFHADAVLRAGYRKQSEWISVEERLPQEGIEVIVALQIGDRLAVDTDRIHGREWFAYGSRGYRGSGYVTHWMPLPEVPKGEE